MTPPSGLLEERRKQFAQELMMCERRVQEFQDKTRGPEVDEGTFPLLTLQRGMCALSGGLGMA